MVSKWTQPTPVGTALDTDARTHARTRVHAHTHVHARARAATTNRIHIHIHAVIALCYNSRHYHGKRILTYVCVWVCMYVCVRVCSVHVYVYVASRIFVCHVFARSLAHVSYVRSVPSSSLLLSLCRPCRRCTEIHTSSTRYVYTRVAYRLD